MINIRKQKSTILLIVVNVIIAIILSFKGDLENADFMLSNGAMYAPYVLHYHEYYRMFTSIFLHFGFEHLINNMMVLFVMGVRLECVADSFKFLIIYILSGLLGNVCSLLHTLNQNNFVVSAGASGAVFGITGALLWVALINNNYIGREWRKELLFVIAVNLFYGFTTSGIDNAAHIGGLISGFLIAAFLCKPMWQKEKCYNDVERIGE